MAICVLFVLNAVWIMVYSKEEENELDFEGVQLTDFSVKIKNLPRGENYGSLAELRAILWNHILRVVKEEH